MVVAATLVTGLSLLVLTSFWGQSFASNWRSLTVRPSAYELSFYNTHTRETLSITYRTGRRYDERAMEEISHLLRDHRNGHSHEIDGALMDMLHDIKVTLETRHHGLKVVYSIISGYRSTATNEKLRKAGGGQGKNSQHTHGKAIDVRVPGVKTEEIRDVAWCLQKGGVGYYKGSNFVHIDTGKVRYWNWKPTASTCGTNYNS